MQQVFSSPLTYYSCCLLSLYQTQLFSLLPKQIESLITFHQPAQATTTDQYPPQLYLSFTTVEYTSHTQDKPSWVNLHTRPPTPHTETDSPICPPSYWFPADNSTAFWRWRRHIRVCACLIILWDCPPEKTEAWVAARMLFVCLQSITNHDFWTSGAKEVVVWCYNRATTKYLMLKHRQTADRQLWCLCTVFTFVP